MFALKCDENRSKFLILYEKIKDEALKVALNTFFSRVISLFIKETNGTKRVYFGMGQVDQRDMRSNIRMSKMFFDPIF